MKLKSIISMVIMVVITLSIYSVSYADCWSGTTNKVNSEGKIYFWKDSSIESYGYSAKFTSAISNWQFSVDAMSFSNVTSADDYTDRWYVGDTVISGLGGQIIPRKKNWLGLWVTADLDEDWSHCKVYVYDNQMDYYNLTTLERVSNITHELGHSLKLDHPSTTQISVMNQGIQDIGPSAYDEQEYLSKW